MADAPPIVHPAKPLPRMSRAWGLPALLLVGSAALLILAMLQARRQGGVPVGAAPGGAAPELAPGPSAQAAESLSRPLYRIYEAPGVVTRRLLGDWEPSRAIAMAWWPAWPEAAEALIDAVTRRTAMVLLVHPVDRPDEILQWLGERGLNRSTLRVQRVPFNTAWARDWGPVQIVASDGGIVWGDPIYSGEGRKDDDQVPRALGAALGVKVEPYDVTTEGGAIVSNGRGLCVATRQSLEYAALWSPSAQRQVHRLMETIGCERLVAVPALLLEPTSHVDMMVQFLAHDLVMVAEVDPEAAPDNALRLQQAVAGIRAAAKSLGDELRVVHVPLHVGAGGRYYTYVNGLTIGRTYLVPQYHGVPRDIQDRAWDAIRTAGDGFELVPIPSDRLLDFSGSVHCVTVELGHVAP